MRKSIAALLLGFTLLLGACGHYDSGFYRNDLRSCNPPNANGIMAWAQGAGGVTGHSRSAQVTNRNGFVDCTTEEVASSSRGTPVPPSSSYGTNYFLVQPQYGHRRHYYGW